MEYHIHTNGPLLCQSTLCGRYIFKTMKQFRKDSDRSAQQQFRKQTLNLRGIEFEMGKLDAQDVKNMRNIKKALTDTRENNQEANNFTSL